VTVTPTVTIDTWGKAYETVAPLSGAVAPTDQAKETTSALDCAVADKVTGTLTVAS
jgi:hypothetical protein